MAPNPGLDQAGRICGGLQEGRAPPREGELRSREYETDSGVKARTYVIVASSIVNLRPGQGTSMSEPESDQATAPADAWSRNQPEGGADRPLPIRRFVGHGRIPIASSSIRWLLPQRRAGSTASLKKIRRYVTGRDSRSGGREVSY